MKEKDKTALLHFPVILTAFWAIFRLTGLPASLHLTFFRILLILLVLLGCIGWAFLRNRQRAIAEKEGIRAIFVQTNLLFFLIFAFTIPIGRNLMARDGMLYTFGAFIRQAEPFLIFLCVLSLCCVFCIAAAIPSGRIRLLTENTLIPQITLILFVSILLFGAYFPLRENYYPSHDYSIFAYIGQQILRGRMPYTELWDHKPPVIFYLNAFGLKLAGGSLAGIWLAEFLAFFIGSLIIFRIMRRRFSTRIALPVLLCGMLHYARVLDFGNYTEEVSLFFALCTLGLAFDGHPDQKPHLKGLLAGLLCGLAFTCKQNTVGCWAALFLSDLIQCLPVKKDRDKFRNRRNFWLMAGLGFLLINAAWCVYFAAHQALSAYWDVAFRFNFIYSEHSGESRLATMWTTLTFLPSVSPYLLLAFLSWIPVCISGFRERIRKFSITHPLAAWALIALPIELVFAGLSGMNYQHYFILCIPPAIVLLCEILSGISKRLNLQVWAFRIAVPLILLAASLPLLPVYRENYTVRTPSAYTKARDYLIRETSPDEPILVWGSRSALYVMSERYAPTAYFNERPLYLIPGEVQAEQWEELLQDLRSDPPQVVIWTHDSALPFIETAGGSCEIPDMPAYTHPVYQYFCENYRYETTVNEGFRDAWEVFRRR